MSFTTEINKLLKNRQLCMILAILAFLGVVVFFYNSQKATSVATMQNSNMPPSQHGGAHQQAPPPGVSPAMPADLIQCLAQPMV